MVQLANKIKLNGFPTNLLLQVHDELVLEVDPTVIAEIKDIVISTMEKAVSLTVPLVVHAAIGDNWMDAK